jgi:ATP synthase I chain
MTTADERFFLRAFARIVRIFWALAAGGAAAAFVFRGWRWSAGFALGAAISWINFGWWKRITEALGSPPPRARWAVILGLRYLLLAGGAYVILRLTPISMLAALAGLFVAVAAVIVEILVELVYARNGALDHPDL